MIYGRIGGYEIPFSIRDFMLRMWMKNEPRSFFVVDSCKHSVSVAEVFLRMGDNTFMSIIGIVCIILFPLIVLILSWIGSNAETNKTILGYGLSNRSFSTFQATCALVSTWVCGGYFFGTMESIVDTDKGFTWTLVPWAYAISFILNSVLFCELLYESDSITVFDPIFRKFGGIFGTIVSIPSLLVDLIWTAISFSILKSYFNILFESDLFALIIFLGICVAVVAIICGMTSQKYIGIVCFVIMFLLAVIITVSLSYQTTMSSIRDNRDKWLGSLETRYIGEWIDQLVALILGGTCWSTFYQHFLSCRSFHEGYSSSLLSCFGCLFFGVIACFLGIALSTIDWSEYSKISSVTDKRGIFCYSIQALLPAIFEPLAVLFIVSLTFGSLFGSVFSFSTVFAENVYKEVFNKHAKENEILLVWKISIGCMTGVALLLALLVPSLPSLFPFITECLFLVVFPQLLLTLWFPQGVNLYGAIVGLIVTVILRWSVGIEALGIAAWWKLPVGFPFRLMIVLVELIIEVCISKLFNYLIAEKNVTSLYFLSVFLDPVSRSPSNRPARSRSHSLKIIDV